MLGLVGWVEGWIVLRIAEFHQAESGPFVVATWVLVKERLRDFCGKRFGMGDRYDVVIRSRKDFQRSVIIREGGEVVPVVMKQKPNW